MRPDKVSVLPPESAGRPSTTITMSINCQWENGQPHHALRCSCQFSPGQDKGGAHSRPIMSSLAHTSPQQPLESDGDDGSTAQQQQHQQMVEAAAGTTKTERKHGGASQTAGRFNQMYQTPEFLMWCYKILPCARVSLGVYIRGQSVTESKRTTLIHPPALQSCVYDVSSIIKALDYLLRSGKLFLGVPMLPARAGNLGVRFLCWCGT